MDGFWWHLVWLLVFSVSAIGAWRTSRSNRAAFVLFWLGLAIGAAVEIGGLSRRFASFVDSAGMTCVAAATWLVDPAFWRGWQPPYRDRGTVRLIGWSIAFIGIALLAALLALLIIGAPARSPEDVAALAVLALLAAGLTRLGGRVARSASSPSVPPDSTEPPDA